MSDGFFQGETSHTVDVTIQTVPVEQMKVHHLADVKVVQTIDGKALKPHVLKSQTPIGLRRELAAWLKGKLNVVDHISSASTGSSIGWFESAATDDQARRQKKQ